ncbi:2-oxoacid dehydrogenases acyltransferase-domain-containing protein [Blyttiomyces helicus]|uniref:Dihydrolipoamide acetyltransferase component of pyruvate dehydrogenase complex n=1 Tax=Blyttiomyces helicus TaxID=388810 RepID=A0A4P9W5W0_9FUNG|nr:2-oxoacid dehydrogenases acyltransferase-domain-containing protein [Blyttiomyces helicus]|eukprot:RKO86140.1 2-oxoacid dehydrogenases acyltransferase-domain-containing protein [Blyttiomyces helicus]
MDEVTFQARPVPVAASSFVLAARRGYHATSPARQLVPFLLADIGEGITECEVIQWRVLFVKPGEKVEQFTPICEVQSDKAAVEITSRYDGVIRTLYYKTGDVARVGKPLVDIETSGGGEDVVDAPAAAPEPVAVAAAPTSATPTPARPVATKEEREASYVLATPAVRRVARENSVDLNLVAGSGPSGRILKGDVLAYVDGSAAPAVASPAATTLVPLTPIQKAMFKTMTKSLAIPHLGFSEEIVLDSATHLRGTINRMLKEHKHQHSFHKISYMPIFLKAMSLALNKYPIMNACLVDAEDATRARLQYRAAHNIGIAMDTPAG